MFFTDERSWFHRKRFGMWAHWGIYSIHGIHEQELWRLNRRLTDDWTFDPVHFDPARWIEPQKKYEALKNEFNPQKFNPAQWLDMMQENGFDYFIFTTKHHDGFCMWDTHETDFNIMNTPYKKDIFGMIAEECHKRDFPLVAYYSIADWHQKTYPNLGGDHEIETDPALHNMPEYAEFVRRQLREICTNYGKISGIWWDMNSRGWQDPSISAMIRELQPAAVQTNRGFAPGDYVPAERQMPGDLTPFTKPEEGCQSVWMVGWGYSADGDHFSVRKLEQQTALFVARGGNFILNAGPKADGTFPEEALKRLRITGEWRKAAGSALTAPPCPDAVKLPRILCTGKDRELNLVFLDPLDGESLRLEGLNILPEKAILLNTGEEIPVTMAPTIATMQFPPMVRLRKLPADSMAGTIPVIRLIFKDPVVHPGMAVMSSPANQILVKNN